MASILLKKEIPHYKRSLPQILMQTHIIIEIISSLTNINSIPII